MKGGRSGADVRRSHEQTTIYLRGELDGASAAEARTAIDQALSCPSRTLALDLSGLAFMDSAGIWLVIDTHRRCVEAGIELRLAGERQAPVAHALELAGVETVIGSPQAEADGNREERVLLRLYLSSRSAASSTTVKAFRAAAERLPADAVQMEVIDVFEDPVRAQSDRVIATPTLIKVQPHPELRLIGSIADEDAILQYLGLQHLAA
jgi:circadian clock protein KaiB